MAPLQREPGQLGSAGFAFGPAVVRNHLYKQSAGLKTSPALRGGAGNRHDSQTRTLPTADYSL
jgi:hypothetical protein